jgi:hypothetical protein
MVASFKMLFPSVVDGGFYVIEDVLHAFQKSFGGSVKGAEPMALAKDIMISMNSARLPLERRSRHCIPTAISC